MNDSAAVADAVARALEQYGAEAVLNALSDAADAAGDHLAVPGNPVGHPSSQFREAARLIRAATTVVRSAEKTGEVSLAQAADVLAEMAVEGV